MDDNRLAVFSVNIIDRSPYTSLTQFVSVMSKLIIAIKPKLYQWTYQRTHFRNHQKIILGVKKLVKELEFFC